MNDQIRQIAGRIRELREILEVDAEELATIIDRKQTSRSG